MPFFNSERFIAEAIESVVHQTFASWELILVDDGSSDGSTAIAKTFAADHPDRIRYLQHRDHQNRGTPTSRNLGIAHAFGEYIANLDHDDVWTRTKLEEQVAVLDSHPTVAMTFGPMILWGSWEDGASSRSDVLQAFTFPTNTLFHPPDYVPLLLTGKNDPHGYLIRRNAVDGVGGYVDNVGFCGDWALYIKIALRHEIYVAGFPNYYYRQHSGQMCRLLRQAGGWHSEFLPFLNWLRKYLGDTGCRHRRVMRAFAAATRRNRLNRWLEASSRRARQMFGLRPNA